MLKTNVRTSAGGEDRSSRSVRGRGDSIKKLLRYFLLFCVVPSAQIHVLIIFLVKKINYELIYYDCRTRKRRSRFDETPKSFLASCAAKASELRPFFLFRTAAVAAAECTVSGVVPICCWLAAAELLGSSCVAGARLIAAPVAAPSTAAPGPAQSPAEVTSSGSAMSIICCWLAAAELLGSSCVAGAKGASWFPAAECTVSGVATADLPICCWLAAVELPGSSCVASECWVAAAECTA